MLAALSIVSALLAQAEPPARAEEPAVRAAPALTPPRLVGDPVVARYPAARLAERAAARVVLDLEVEEDGKPGPTRVVTAPQPGFDESALAAAALLRFEPGRLGDKPVRVRIQYAFNFRAPEPAAPPPVNLAGTVRERGTRRRLAGIEVTVPAAALSAITDAQGRFELRGVPSGDAEVLIAASGYQRFSAKEHLAEGERTEVDYRIEPVFSSPYEAVVTGERERREISKTTISNAELQHIPGAQGDSLKVIEDLPGVARTSPIGGGLLVVRGSKPGDSLVYLDGEPIPLLFHFGALSATVNADLLEAIEFVPGNFSANYGDLTGGLVEVKTRKLRDELHGYANLNLLESSVLLEGAVHDVPGLTIAAAGRRSYIDYVLKAALPKSEDLGLTVAPRYYDAQLRVDYAPPGSAHRLSLLALTSDDALGLVLNRPPEQDPNVSGSVDTDTAFTQVRLKHEYRSGRLSVQTVGMFEKLLLAFYIGPARLRLLAHDLFLRSTATFDASEDVSVSLGLDAAYRRLHVAAKYPPSFALREGELNSQGPRVDEADLDVPDTLFNRVSPALWAEARLRLLPGLTLTPGLRLDDYAYGPAEPHTTSTVTPRLSLRWEVAPELALKAGAGLYSEGARNGDAAYPFGNPAVLPERAFQLTAGAEVRPLTGIFCSVEGFYKGLSDLIVRTGALENVGGVTRPQLLDNAGTGRVFGLEALVRKELTDRMFGWIAYTLSRSDRIDRPGQPRRLFDFDQTHNLTAILSYKLPGGWQLGGRLRVITGNPDTPVIGSRYLAQQDVYLPLYGQANSARNPAFNQLDVRVDKVWTFDAWQLDAYVDVLNAYNRRAVEGTIYSYDFAQKDYFHGLPVIPTLGVKGSF